MTGVISLRARLFALILTPLLMIACGLGFWRVTEARATSEELFDRALLSAALAVSRDVAVSGGDALLPSTAGLIGDASGGEVFYHVTGPGGIYVTGYAYPPRPEALSLASPFAPLYFTADYRGNPVRALLITETQTIDALTGDTKITVWQRLADRNRFTRALVLRALVLIGVLLASLAVVVWLAVRWGLRPLLELEEAISLRSPDDLRPVQRGVPHETTGIVRTFNRLLGQIQTSIQAHQVFISDAAHQLRNPAAAVQSLAEAVRDAPTEAARKERLEALIHAARTSSRTAEALLSLDRLRQSHLPIERTPLDLPDAPIPLSCDRLLVAEALKNLIDNALKHGGTGLAHIQVRAGADHRDGWIEVWDDGVGIAPEARDRALQRFSQLSPSAGSGLGLAIVETVARRHGGTVGFLPSDSDLPDLSAASGQPSGMRHGVRLTLAAG